MMRFFSILILLVSFSVHAQEWKRDLDKAREAYSKQEYDKAMYYYHSAQNKTPKGVDLSKEIGQTAYKNKNYEYAESLFHYQSQNETNKEEVAKAYHNLGNTLMQQKKYDEAIDAYKNALRNNTSNEKTRHNLSEAMRLKKKEEQQNNQNQQQNQNSQQNNSQNQQQKNQQQQNQNNQQNNSQNPQSQQQSSRQQMQNKAIDKKLDELMKQEATTKRNMRTGNPNHKKSTSGKDW